MTRKLIAPESTLQQQYDVLLRRARQLDLALVENKTVICRHCKRPLKEHHYEERKCDLYVTSLTFSCNEQEEAFQIQKALGLIEQLLAIVIP